MTNPKILSDLLKAAGKLPKGSPAAREAVGAKIAAEEAEKAALYKAQPIATETGRKAIAQSKQTLMTPEQQAKMEAELREKGKQKFLEPSKVKERLYHGTSKADLTEFKTGKAIKEKQYPGNTIDPWAVDNRDAVFLTPSPEFSGKYSGGDWDINLGYTPTIYPVHVQVKNPWDYENPEHIENVIQAYKEKYPLQRDKSGAVPSEESLRHYRFEKNVRELPLREKDNWSGVEQAALQEIIKSLGHDAFFVKEAGIKNLGVYDPRRIKSATGNIGTYDITTPDITKKDGGLAMATGGQAFPLQEEFQAEVERRAARPRTRAGVPVEDTNVLGGALRGLANTLGGLAFGRTVGTLGMPADIFEPTAAPGAMIPMFGMAGMPSEISKALVQQFAPKGPDIPAPTSEYLLEKGLEKFKPPQEFEVSAKLGRFMPFDIAEMQAAGRKLKALQPTFTELMETGLERATAPARMYAAPEDGAKLSKEEYSRMMREKYAAQNLAREEKKVTAADLKPQEVKVPADELGFYSPAEKAAANLKRNIGTGEAFLSDLRKAPDVGETDLIHAGLENWLKGKKTVSKQEIQDYMTKNRLKLQKEELRAGEGNPDDLRFRGGDAIHDTDYINSVADDYINDWDSIGYRTREEIRNEKLRQYTPEEAEQLINSGQLDEMVDEEIRDLAYRLAEDQYYDDPYREWENELGYTIFGNDDVGYSIRSPNGDDITSRRGIYDFETAEGAVQQHAMENGYVSEDGTQYHDYQLEGPSTNYREHLTRLDRGKSRGDLQQELADVRRAMDDPLDQQEYNSLAKRRDELEDELSQHHKPYESSHWPGDDVVSHSRTQDRVDVEGKDTLHIDELQSDWHQDGAEFGYADKATRQQYKDLMRERAGLAADFTALRDEISVLSNRAFHNDTMKQHAGYEPFPEVRAKLDEANQRSKDIADKIDEINMRLSDIERAVPDAPFKKDWVEKELKKLLKVAAEEGKERITLSRWQDQLRRWGTDSIGFKKTSDGVWSVTASKNRRLLPGDLDDTATANEIYYKTSLRGGESPVTSKSELRRIVKTDLSKGWSNAHIDRVTNKVWDQMNKLQIDEVGAIDPRKEGFKATYGKSFIDTMQKLAKKLGAKTGTTELSLGSGEYIQVPYIEVSGKAKQSAIKGQPYKTGGAVRKADGGAVHPAVEKFAASLPHPAVTEFAAKLADGGGVWKAMVDGKYNTVPDVNDAERVIQGPAFAKGGGVWEQLVKGAGNA